MFFLQLIPKIFHKVLNFLKILHLPILFTPAVCRERNLCNTPATIYLLFFFSPAAIWSSIVAANCMFFVIFGRKWEAAGIAVQSDCNRRVNDNTAAIAGVYRCKKHEGMIDVKFRLKLNTSECRIYNVNSVRSHSDHFICKVHRTDCHHLHV